MDIADGKFKEDSYGLASLLRARLTRSFSKGDLPKSSSYAKIPRLHESILSEYPSLDNCSGEEYSRQPTTVFLRARFRL